ncbi:DUF4386 family protein [Ilumatobacter coccineus]|uniref:DUF4386 domain-containing protein n=1 Tax=Ilumatobacter coccineus (strain NBRC 103263 / KCTC 29153 / YM16-304) TaxID=1313172 RepID=A0A6C7E5R9_ILUCY|nr:DUF4386 family protein [Ilumatobacter coccineus]BAN03104.1 hypothetical protein YM304_27900 [Ilumatobacter coccineus YM16-304]
MTLHLPHTADSSTVRPRFQRAGGIAALVAAATFVFGIAMFATTMSDYTDPDSTPAEAVDFLVDHQGSLLAWYLGIYIVFGTALVPMALALHERLRSAASLMVPSATVFGFVWVGLMFATGMISNIGIEVVADLAETDAQQATAVWSSIDAVTDGLGGGNELVGGIWVLLVSLVALRTNVLPRSLNILGIVSAVAGVATVIPAFEVIEMVFGLGLIVWFVWVGIALLRSEAPATVDRSMA